MMGFIAGLICGEGCFYIGIHEDESYRVGFKTKPGFRMLMNDSNEMLLKAVQDEIGGRIHNSDSEGTTVIMIDSISGCLELIDMLDSYIEENSMFCKSDKYRAYNEWKEIVMMIDNRRHLSKSGLLEIAERRERVNIDGRGIELTRERIEEIFKEKDSETSGLESLIEKSMQNV